MRLKENTSHHDGFESVSIVSSDLKSPSVLSSQRSSQSSKQLPMQESSQSLQKSASQRGKKADKFELMNLWTRDEHILFLIGLNTYGQNIYSIKELVQTKSRIQIQQHLKLFTDRLKAKELSVDKFLATLDFSNIYNQDSYTLCFEEGIQSVLPKTKPKLYREDQSQKKNKKNYEPDWDASSENFGSFAPFKARKGSSKKGRIFIEGKSKVGLDYTECTYPQELSPLGKELVSMWQQAKELPTQENNTEKQNDGSSSSHKLLETQKEQEDQNQTQAVLANEKENEIQNIIICSPQSQQKSLLNNQVSQEPANQKILEKSKSVQEQNPQTQKPIVTRRLRQDQSQQTNKQDIEEIRLLIQAELQEYVSKIESESSTYLRTSEELIKYLESKENTLEVQDQNKSPIKQELHLFTPLSESVGQIFAKEKKQLKEELATYQAATKTKIDELSLQEELILGNRSTSQIQNGLLRQDSIDKVIKNGFIEKQQQNDSLNQTVFELKTTTKVDDPIVEAELDQSVMSSDLKELYQNFMKDSDQDKIQKELSDDTQKQNKRNGHFYLKPELESVKWTVDENLKLVEGLNEQVQEYFDFEQLANQLQSKSQNQVKDQVQNLFDTITVKTVKPQYDIVWLEEELQVFFKFLHKFKFTSNQKFYAKLKMLFKNQSLEQISHNMHLESQKMRNCESLLQRSLTGQELKNLQLLEARIERQPDQWSNIELSYLIQGLLMHNREVAYSSVPMRSMAQTNIKINEIKHALLQKEVKTNKEQELLHNILNSRPWSESDALLVKFSQQEGSLNLQKTQTLLPTKSLKEVKSKVNSIASTQVTMQVNNQEIQQEIKNEIKSQVKQSVNFQNKKAIAWSRSRVWTQSERAEFRSLVEQFGDNLHEIHKQFPQKTFHQLQNLLMNESYKDKQFKAMVKRKSKQKSDQEDVDERVSQLLVKRKRLIQKGRQRTDNLNKHEAKSISKVDKKIPKEPIVEVGKSVENSQSNETFSVDINDEQKATVKEKLQEDGPPDCLLYSLDKEKESIQSPQKRSVGRPAKKKRTAEMTNERFEPTEPARDQPEPQQLIQEDQMTVFNTFTDCKQEDQHQLKVTETENKEDQESQHLLSTPEREKLQTLTSDQAQADLQSHIKNLQSQIQYAKEEESILPLDPSKRPPKKTGIFDLIYADMNAEQAATLHKSTPFKYRLIDLDTLYKSEWRMFKSMAKAMSDPKLFNEPSTQMLKNKRFVHNAGFKSPLKWDSRPQNKRNEIGSDEKQKNQDSDNQNDQNQQYPTAENNQTGSETVVVQNLKVVEQQHQYKVNVNEQIAEKTIEPITYLNQCSGTWPVNFLIGFEPKMNFDIQNAPKDLLPCEDKIQQLKKDAQNKPDLQEKYQALLEYLNMEPSDLQNLPDFDQIGSLIPILMEHVFDQFRKQGITVSGRKAQFRENLVRLLDVHLPQGVLCYTLNPDSDKQASQDVNESVPTLIALAQEIVEESIAMQVIPENSQELYFALLLTKPFVQSILDYQESKMTDSQVESSDYMQEKREQSQKSEQSEKNEQSKHSLHSSLDKAENKKTEAVFVREQSERMDLDTEHLKDH